MTVRVLGPMDVGATPLSPRERAMLSALVVRLGAAVEPAELAEAYWGEQVPTSWRQQVKTSIGHIRTRLGREAVLTRGSTYVLGIDPDAIDAVRFERLVSNARQRALHGEPDRASDLYARALALWRGQPYPDISSWDPGVVEALRLTEIRTSAEEEWLDARLDAGEHRAVIAEAERLVREDPLREDRWAILALANYRAGRQAEALATVRGARSRLLDELGIDVGPRLQDLETAILRQDPDIAAVNVHWDAAGECPYRGLEPFQLEDADLFFGRDADVDELVERTHRGSVLTIAGPSGSGKSSVLLAGLLPRLTAAGHEVAVLRPGAGGIGMLRTAVERNADVIAIDQAEELMQIPAAQVAEFCAIAAGFLAAGGMVVLTIRSDFLDRATELPGVGAAIGRGVYLLAALTPEALRAAVEQPARHARLRLEPGLVELVIRDSSDRGTTLPHVSHVLRETWIRREGATLTVAGYEAAGGIAGAIAQTAETMFRSLDTPSQQLCRSLLLRLVGRGPDGASLRRRVTAAPLLADPARRELIETLVGARLVTADGDAIVIAHEAIASAWPRLDGWLEEDAEGARLMGSLTSAAETWDADGRTDDGLLRGARLHATTEWVQRADPDLTDVEKTLLTASEEHDSSEMRALGIRAAHDRRQNRLLRWSLGGAAVLLVSALVLGGVAAVRGRDAAMAAEDALIEAVTSRAVALRDTDRQIAAMIAAEAYRRWPDDVRTHAALMSSMTEANGYTGATPIPDAEWRIGAWPIPGASTAFVVRNQTDVGINDYTTGALLRTIPSDLVLPNQPIRPWVRVSADGSTGVVVQHFGQSFEGDADAFEGLAFFDLRTDQQIGRSIQIPYISETVSLSPDGRYATWATTGDLVVAERDTGEFRALVDPNGNSEGPTEAVSTFGADGTLYLSRGDGAIRVMDPVTLTEQHSITIPVGFARGGLVVADDGSTFSIGPNGVLATDANGTVLWQRSDQRFWECSRIAASSEADVAVCGDEGGHIQRWRLSTGYAIGPSFDFQLGAGGDLAFVDDNREVLLLSAGAPVVGHLRVDGSGPTSIPFADGMAASWGPQDLSPSARLLIVQPADTIDSGEDPPEYSIWDIKADRAVFRLPTDVVDPYEGKMVGGRWLREDLLLVWLITTSADEAGEATEHLEPRILDITTGRFIDDSVPADTWEVFPSLQPHTVMLATDEGIIRSFDTTTLTTGEVELRLPTHPEDVRTSGDGSRVLALTRDSETTELFSSTLFDGRTGKVIAEGLSRRQGIAMAPDGTIYAAGFSDVAEYSSTDLSESGSLPNLAGVGQLDVSTDGSTLFTRGASEVGVTIVDLASHRQLGDPIPFEDAGATWMLPDGSGVIVPGPDGLLLWSLDSAAQFAAACKLAGRELTRVEWATYLAELGEQVPTCTGF